jgi:hypothetical protein
MARIRTIKPEFWHDEKLGALKRDERLLFIGLWNLADDQGVCKANPVFIKSSLFPYDEDLRVNTLTSWLGNLQKARMLVPFTFNSESYYMIRTFLDHQVINRPSEPKWPDGFLQNLHNQKENGTHGGLTEGSPPEKEGEQGNGTGKGKGTGKPPLAEVLVFTNPFSEGFLQHWQMWKQFKKEQFKFSYKSVISEQGALNDLVKVSGGDEQLAIAVIEQSIAKGWKGFFELKENKNGQPNSKNGHGGDPKAKGTRSSVKQVFDERYSKS